MALLGAAACVTKNPFREKPAVGLAAMRREYGDGAGGVGVLAVLVIGLCTFIMLMSGVGKARKLVEPHRVSHNFGNI